jgi:two-component SAPR family response regulator
METNFRFKKVMMIDDDYCCRLLAERMLKIYHFADEIIICETAIEALDYLSAHSLSPEIIFLDINMPGMDGFEFLERFQKLKKRIKMNIAIIMLTSSSNFEDKNRAEENSDVYLFLNKPLTKLKLEAISAAFSKSI